MKYFELFSWHYDQLAQIRFRTKTGILFIIFGATLNFSCKKSSSDVGIGTSKDVSQVKQYLMLASETELMGRLADSYLLGLPSNALDLGSTGCTSIQFKDSTYLDSTSGDKTQHLLQLQFSGSCVDGRTRSGSLLYRWQGPYKIWFNPQRLVTVSTTNYVVDGVAFSGSRTIQATIGQSGAIGPRTITNSNFNLSYNQSTPPAGSTLNPWIESQISEWVGGFTYINNRLVPGPISTWRSRTLGNVDALGTAFRGPLSDGTTVSALYSLLDTVKQQTSCRFLTVGGSITLQRSGNQSNISLSYPQAINSMMSCQSNVKITDGNGKVFYLPKP